MIRVMLAALVLMVAGLVFADSHDDPNRCYTEWDNCNHEPNIEHCWDAGWLAARDGITGYWATIQHAINQGGYLGLENGAPDSTQPCNTETIATVAADTDGHSSSPTYEYNEQGVIVAIVMSTPAPEEDRYSEWVNPNGTPWVLWAFWDLTDTWCEVYPNPNYNCWESCETQPNGTINCKPRI